LRFTKLELIKNVTNNNGGNVNATAWTFSATGTGGFTNQSLSAISAGAFSSRASTGEKTVNAGVQYTLSESGPGGYSPGNWSCDGGTFVSPDKITLALGADVICQITNDDIAPSLTLIKNVTNNDGGSSNATAWTFSATGTGGFSGQALSTIAAGGFSSRASTGAQTVTANVQYTLSESGPSGYTAGDWSCDSGTYVSPDKITLAPGATVTCQITNNDIAPKLTLIKNVTNDSGKSNVATEWALSATGTGGFTNQALSSIAAGGFSSRASTGEQTVDANIQYTLSESGPGGYSPGNWSCDGGTFVSPDKITLALAANVTCQITNNDNAANVTLSSTQSWRIYDSVTVNGFVPGATTLAQVKFQLYNNSTCTGTPVGESAQLDVDNTAGTASFSTGVPIPSPGSSGTATYYWKLTFYGNEFNLGVGQTIVLDCKESTTITHNDNLP
jgi:Prealbumin-like fold domain